MNFENPYVALTGVAQLVGCRSAKWKAAGSIPRQGAYLGFGFCPQSGRVRQAIDQCFSPSLSPSLPLSLKITWKRKRKVKQYAKWKKPFAKGHILCDSTYMECPEQANPQRQQVDWWGWREKTGEWVVTGIGFGVSFCGDKNVIKLIVMMVI